MSTRYRCNGPKCEQRDLSRPLFTLNAHNYPVEENEFHFCGIDCLHEFTRGRVRQAAWNEGYWMAERNAAAKEKVA